jgi:polyisoprenoid-binding protein YceI
MSELPDAAADNAAADNAAAGRWVLDPAGSRADFYVKHFWGAMTVHGWFGQLTGEATVASDGSATGTVTIDAASLNTKNKQRDKHLRSADFFAADTHPHLTIAVAQASLTGPDALTGTGTIEIAGQAKPLEFAAQVEQSESAIVLRTEVTIDRTEFGITWSPLKMTAPTARTTVVARFVRA